MTQQQDISALAAEIESTRKILTALGDETRQHLILVMMQTGSCTGLRVNEIATRTSLSRPAVSHHLQILKDAGIVRCRREGTRNYYYFDDSARSLEKLIAMLEHTKQIMQSLPDRSGDD